MTYIETVLWRSLRKIYGKMTGFQKSAVIVEETDPLKASDAIYTLLVFITIEQPKLIRNIRV